MSQQEIEIHRIQRRVTRLQGLCMVQFLIFLGYVWLSHDVRTVKAQETILRSRGLIIEDAQGRPRVLLGAPFPSVSARSRKDATTEAMVFLDEAGHDRLTLGEAPDPQVSGRVLHRIAPHFGIVIHDSSGDERGAYGYLANGRVVVTLDRPGHEAWTAIVNDKTGFSGMTLLYPPGDAEGGDAIEMGTEGPESYLRMKDTGGTNRTILQIQKGKDLSVQTVDANSRVIRDLSRPE